MRGWWAAVGFLTILPVPASTDRSEALQVLYFPMVGLLIGAMAWGVDRLCQLGLPGEVRPVVVVLFFAVITGALHLDGLADTADGLFSHRDREGVLSIMRDSRIGVMGCLALIFCLALKTASLAALDSQVWAWLLAAPALGRTAQAAGLTLMPYARPEGRPFQFLFQKGRFSLLSLGWAGMVPPFFLGVVPGLWVLVVFLGITGIYFWFLKMRLGGLTGDTLGALTELVETGLFLLGACLIHSS